MEKKQGKRKTVVGIVRSDRMSKTITVDVTSRRQHPKYGKFVLKTHRFVAHDEKEEAGIGDLVEISETRPLSKTKRWRLLRIVETGHRPEEVVS